MTSTLTIQAIRKHLESKPDDWQARMELADLYEELGDLNRSKTQRWLIKNKKYPENHSYKTNTYLRGWFWYYTSGSEHWLPEQVLNNTRFGIDFKSGLSNILYPNCRGFNSCEDAEDELMQAFVKLNWKEW